LTSAHCFHHFHVVIRRLFSHSGTLLLLIFAWKIALLVFSAQPIPSNDAFFYDGPVVNFLLNGRYINPSLTLALPISGTQVFCAYPPLYQGVLLAWMFVCGTSAFSAIAFHIVLFGGCLLLLFGIFRKLLVPPWCAGMGALFLFVLTFHDRPDTLAHLFGLAAIYSWSRHSLSPSVKAQSLVAILCILAIATSLQLGAVYICVVWVATLGASLLLRENFLVLPMLATILVPIALVAWVRFGFPLWWTGFLEHARQTPSFTGLRIPRLVELLKILRTAPGIICTVFFLPLLLRRWKSILQQPRHNQLLGILLLSSTIASLGVIAASMFFWTPNAVFMTCFLQPLIVAGCLTVTPLFVHRPRMLSVQTAAFIGLAALGAIRAIGMTTWGLACAHDFGYSAAIQEVSTELENVGEEPVVLSSAYLYEAARHPNVRAIHSDWLAPASRDEPNHDLAGLIKLKPAKLILTQFDYYRRYRNVCAALQARPELVSLQVADAAHLRTPDSFKSIQQVIQHISWAPVVVTMSWKN